MVENGDSLNRKQIIKEVFLTFCFLKKNKRIARMNCNTRPSEKDELRKVEKCQCSIEAVTDYEDGICTAVTI